MFSRATKSVVKSLGQCSYSVGGENFKAITATGEFGQSLSQFLKKSSKFESVTVNEGITKSTQNGFNFQEGKKLHSYKDTMPELTRFRLNSESKSSDVTGNLSQIQKIPSLEAKKEGEDIIDILRKFPLAEESETANHLQMMPHTLQGGRDCARNSGSPQIGQIGPTRFWNFKKSLKNYQGIEKLKKMCNSTKSGHLSWKKNDRETEKRISRDKTTLIFSAKFTSPINHFSKLSYRHFRNFLNNRSIVNKEIFSLFNQNQSFRFISTKNVNLTSKKSKCDNKIKDYCRQMKEKISGSKGNSKESPEVKKIDPCQKSKNKCLETKNMDPCKKEETNPCGKKIEENPYKNQKESPKMKKRGCFQKSKSKFPETKIGDQGKKEKTDPCGKKIKENLCKNKKESPEMKKPDPGSKPGKECPEIKNFEPCKKKECPPVFRAPDCPPKKNKS